MWCVGGWSLGRRWVIHVVVTLMEQGKEAHWRADSVEPDYPDCEGPSDESGTIDRMTVASKEMGHIGGEAQSIHELSPGLQGPSVGGCVG